MFNKDLIVYDMFINLSFINKQLLNVVFINKFMEVIYLVLMDENKFIMGMGSSSVFMGNICSEVWYNEIVQFGGYCWFLIEVKEDGSVLMFWIVCFMKNLQGIN